MSTELSDEATPDNERRPVSWRVMAFIVVIVVVVGVGAAIVVKQVSHKSTQTVSISVFTDAQSKTVKANDFKMSMKFTFSANGKSVAETANGLMSFTPVRQTMTLDLPGGLGELEIRGINHTVYMRLGSNVTASGKHWASVQVPDVSGALGSGTDPLATLRLLAGAAGKVTRKGTQSIDGARTTHYHANADPSLLAARLPDSLKTPGFDSVIAAVKSIPIDVYIGDDGLVRRVEDHVKVEGTTTHVVMDLTPVAARSVRVTPPPAADVARESNITAAFADLGLDLPTS
jgi:hypothetical protein